MKHEINADREFFGYKMRTRRHYHDDHILRAFFKEKDQNHYRLPDNPKVVVDVGANIGCVSILSAEKGAEVFAYEPATDNYETLVHNIELNGYEDKVHCIKKGVGTPGEAKLYIHPRNSGATSIYLDSNTGHNEEDFEMVEIISIKDVFEQNNIEHCDLLKLDCEGAEKDILLDLDDDLASKIDQISVEYHWGRAKRRIIKDHLGKWYDEEHIRRYEYVYRKK